MLRLSPELFAVPARDARVQSQRSVQRLRRCRRRRGCLRGRL